MISYYRIFRLPVKSMPQSNRKTQKRSNPWVHEPRRSSTVHNGKPHTYFTFRDLANYESPSQPK